MRNTVTGLMLALALAASAGCGKDVVVGGQREVDAAATGDGTDENGSPASSSAEAFGPRLDHVAGRVQGTITFDARVEMVAGTRVEPVNDAPATVTVQIDGDDTVRIARGAVDDLDYTAVRVTFTRVEANVTAGLVIGGVELTGQVQVSPGTAIQIERPIEPGTSGDIDLLVDLDASAWLFTTNPATRLVAAAAFQNAVKVRLR